MAGYDSVLVPDFAELCNMHQMHNAHFLRYSTMTAGCSRCTCVEWPQSLCCRFLCANDLAVNLHLSDENADFTMIRRRYVFSNSSGFFSCHLSVFALVPNSLLCGSCKCKSQVSCQHCRLSCSSRVHHPASSITHLVLSGTPLIISRNTGEPYARPRMLYRTIFLPFTSNYAV